MKKILIAFLLFIFTAPATLVATPATTNSTSTANSIIISGTVYVDGEPQHGVVLAPKGLSSSSLNNFNTASSAESGHFTISKFPVNTDLVAMWYTEDDQTISYAEIESNPSNVNVYISSTPVDATSTMSVELDSVTVQDTNKCNTDAEKNRLHASKARFIDTGKTITYKAGQTINGKKITENATVNERICIPTECINNNYILENPDTPNAVCTDCKTLISHSATAHVNNGRCVAVTCESGYLLENGACTKCTDKVPYSTSAHAAGNSCVADTCQKNFKVTNGKCVVDCSAPDILKSLHATAASVKPNAVLPTQITRNFDFTKYCYPTECDTPRYEKRGTGETTTCFDLNNTSCTPTDTAHAQNGTYELRNNKLLCKPNCIGSNYTAKLNETKTDYYCAIKKDRSNEPCTNADIRRLKQAKKLDEHATKGDITEWDDKDNTVLACSVTECETGWEPNVEKTACVSTDGTDCTPQIDNAKSAKLQNGKCVLQSCNRYYKVNKTTNRCDDQRGKKCEPVETLHKLTGDNNASHGTITDFEDGEIKACEITGCVKNYAAVTENGKTTCVIKQCSKCSETWDNKTKRCVPAWNQNTARCTNTTTPKLPQHAQNAIKTCDVDDDSHEPYCAVKSCSSARYTPVKINSAHQENDACEDQNGKPCTPTAKYASTTGTTAYDNKNDKIICIPDSCTATGYVVDKKTGNCVLNTNACPDDVLAQYPNATAGTIKTRDTDGSVKDCIVTECNKNYEPNEDNTKCVPVDKSGQKCTAQQLRAQDAHATAGIVKLQNGRQVCAITSCSNGYEPYIEPGASFAVSCVSTKCTTCGEEWDEKKQKCVTWAESGNTECTANSTPRLPTNATKATKTCDNGKAICKISACAVNYTLNQNTNSCVSSRGLECKMENPDPNAAVTTLHRVNGALICQIDACKTGYDVNKSKTACIARNVASEQEVKELKEKAAQMKEKENSLANRTVGAAGIAATGIGGAMIGAALSEQRLDAAAEGAMRAYIETFRCDYGDGKNVQGGETDVTLPGGNDMFNLYTQYANLANDLKIRKDALGLKPGIESEVVIDKADTGLYDDVGTGITGGNYASVARALMNPDGADAAAWNEQKNKTADTLKAGAITAGVGAAGSLTANIAVNSNKDKQNKTNENQTATADDESSYTNK